MTDENRKVLIKKVDKWTKALDAPKLSRYWKLIYINFNTTLICHEVMQEVIIHKKNSGVKKGT